MTWALQSSEGLPRPHSQWLVQDTQASNAIGPGERVGELQQGAQKAPKGFHTLQPRSALKLKAVGSPCWTTRSVGRATICQCTPKNKVIDHGSTFQGWVAGSKYLYHRDPPETGDLHCF